jgi:hypothetical protein
MLEETELIARKKHSGEVVWTYTCPLDHHNTWLGMIDSFM